VKSKFLAKDEPKQKKPDGPIAGASTIKPLLYGEARRHHIPGGSDDGIGKP